MRNTSQRTSRRRPFELDANETWITPKEAAALLKISVEAIYQGKGGTERIGRVRRGRKLLLDRADVLRLTDGQELITPEEAARLLGVSVSSIYSRAAGTAALKRVRFGKNVRLLRAEVLRFSGMI